MRKTIHSGILAALAALALSAASASAAPPAWFNEKDLDRDGRVTLAEYVRADRAFDVLDENGDGRVSPNDQYGADAPRSSWLQVGAWDADRDFTVSRYEYAQQLRAIFDSYDQDRDGVLSGGEVETNGVSDSAASQR